MKKLLLSICVVALGSSVIANNPVNDIPVEKVQTQTGLNQIYGKRLTVANHVIDGQAVSHERGDYLLIKSDGTYEKQFQGNKELGTWTHDAAQNTITLKARQTSTYVIAEVSSSHLKLTTKNSELMLRAITKPQLKPKK